MISFDNSNNKFIEMITYFKVENYNSKKNKIQKTLKLIMELVNTVVLLEQQQRLRLHRLMMLVSFLYRILMELLMLYH